jgi:Caspase domain/PDZ domain
MGDQRFGLLVANSEFESEGISRLRGPPADVASLADVLRRVDIGAFQIETLVNCYRTVVEEAIQEFFGERKRDDLALLYFAGHGLKNDKGNLYFAMKETKRRRLESTALSSRFIHDMMQNSPARRQVLIFDCCFSGAFPRGFTFRADESIDSGHYFEAKGSGQLILTACDEMQYAFEGDDLIEKNVTSSVFTGILVDGFTSGDADVDLDGQISFKDLYEYAVAKMRSRGSPQIPQRWHFGIDDLILANNPNQGVQARPEARHEVRTPPDSPPPPRPWHSIKLTLTSRRRLTVVVIAGGALIIFLTILGLIRFSGPPRISVVTPAPTVVPTATVATPTPTTIESVTPSPTQSEPDVFVPMEPVIVAHALHVVELGLDVAFLTPGAQVRVVESGGAAEKAGIMVGDIIEAIGKQKIDSLDNMRKSFRELGPGKTQFTIRRSGARMTILVDCPNC